MRVWTVGTLTQTRTAHRSRPAQTNTFQYRNHTKYYLSLASLDYTIIMVNFLTEARLDRVEAHLKKVLFRLFKFILLPTLLHALFLGTLGPVLVDRIFGPPPLSPSQSPTSVAKDGAQKMDAYMQFESDAQACTNRVALSDSGASATLTNERCLLHQYAPIQSTQRFRDAGGKLHKVVGEGILKIPSVNSNGHRTYALFHCWYIPTLKGTYISPGGTVEMFRYEAYVQTMERKSGEGKLMFEAKHRAESVVIPLQCGRSNCAPYTLPLVPARIDDCLRRSEAGGICLSPELGEGAIFSDDHIVARFRKCGGQELVNLYEARKAGGIIAGISEKYATGEAYSYCSKIYFGQVIGRQANK